MPGNLVELESHKDQASKILSYFILHPRRFFVILLIPALLVGGIIFLFYERTNIETRNWSEFHNDNISFKYPPNFSPKIDAGSNFTAWYPANSPSHEKQALVFSHYAKSPNFTNFGQIEKDYLNQGGRQVNIKTFSLSKKTAVSLSLGNTTEVFFSTNNGWYVLIFNKNLITDTQMNTLLSTVMLTNSEKSSVVTKPTPSPTPIPILTSMYLNVRWNKEPVNVKSNGFFALLDKTTPFTSYNPNTKSYTTVNLESKATYYKVGSIDKDRYKGGEVYLGILSKIDLPPSEGFGKTSTTYYIYFIQMPNGHFILPHDLNSHDLYTDLFFDKSVYSALFLKNNSLDISKTLEKAGVIIARNVWLDRFDDPHNNDFEYNNNTQSFVLYPNDILTRSTPQDWNKITQIDSNHAIYSTQRSDTGSIPYMSLLSQNVQYFITMPNGMSLQGKPRDPIDYDLSDIYVFVQPQSYKNSSDINTMHWVQGEYPSSEFARYFETSEFKANGKSRVGYGLEGGAGCYQNTLGEDSGYLQLNNLEEVATDTNGDTYYVILDSNNPYDTFYYQDYKKGLASPMDYQTFLSYDPVLVRKNTFGIYGVVFLVAGTVTDKANYFSLSCFNH